MTETDGREDGFRRLYAAHFDAVLGYALRRTTRSEDAADVVSDTFLVAWRRWEEVPRAEEARPWLYGVARRTLSNQRRGDHRRQRLGERLRGELAACVPDPAEEVVARHDAESALERLADRDREVAELSLWEGLEPREIAEVLGVSSVAVRSRLSRLRGWLRQQVRNDPDLDGHLSSTTELAGKED